MTIFCIVWEFLFSSFLIISTELVLLKALRYLVPSLQLFRDYYLILKSLLCVLVSTVGCNSRLEDLNLLKLFLKPLSPILGFSSYLMIAILLSFSSTAKQINSSALFPASFSQSNVAPNTWGKKTQPLAFFSFFGCATRLVGSQLPDQGLNPGPWQRTRRVLTTGPPGKSPIGIFDEPICAGL